MWLYESLSQNFLIVIIRPLHALDKNLLSNCNPADFVSVYSKELSDIDVVKEKLICVIASKFNMTADKFRENYGNEIFKKDWKFEDKNKALTNIISKYK